MSLLRFTWIPILACAVAGMLPAQNRPVPIEPLLRSHDPRLVALGARESAARPDDAMMALMIEMVEHWDPWQRHRMQNEQRYDAMLAILDALIQTNQVVPASGLAAISYAFPEQALILAARLPFEDSEPLLLSWYDGGNGVTRFRTDWEGEDRLLLARVAGMMLAKGRSQSLAPRVLESSEERLRVYVTDERIEPVLGCVAETALVSACGQGSNANPPTVAPRPGWPDIYRYDLEENAPYGGPVLVEAGGDRISYRRVLTGSDLGNCYPLLLPSRATRHHLLAEMLGIDDPQMTWCTEKDVTFPWVTDDQYLRDMTELVAGEEKEFRKTSRSLFHQGLLTKSQLVALRPRLAVIVVDERTPGTPAKLELPILQVQDSRTNVLRGSWR
jgi:hypothetical protein